ncbi:MAG: TolC family protein [Verrucomicrobiota bacterium JB022]|nr:TolC family protein [Verrucomicrobiota bacterium JB022]
MKCLSLLLLLGITLPLRAQTTAPAQVLTLQDALQRASRANLQLLLSQEQVTEAQTNVGTARSALLPSVTGEASQSRNQQYLNFGDQLSGTLTTDSFSALLQARLSIFDYNAWTSYRGAKLGVQVAEAQLEETVQDIWQQIGQSYLLHLRNERQIDVIEAAIERDRTLFDQAQERADAGVASALDLNRAEVQLASSEFQLVEQETAAYESELTLKRLLNLPLDQPLQLVDPELEDVGEAAFNGQQLQEILDQRAAVRQARLAIQRSQVALRSARGERLPDVALTGNYGVNGEDMGDTHETWGVQLGVSVPIWEGGRITAEALRARSQLRQSELQLEQTIQQLGVDYRLTLDQLRAARRQVEIAERRVRLSRSELDLARTSFQEGIADNSELTDAQANLATAEDQLVQARYALDLAVVNLARVRGRVQEVAQ